MTAPYRTPEASLRAEVERLTRELATMRGRRRWRVTGGWPVLSGSVGVTIGHAVYWPGHGLRDRLAFLAIMLPIIAVMWPLAFVRRVPVGGGGR